MTFSVFDHFNQREVVAPTTHAVADNFNVDLTTAGLPQAPTGLTVTAQNTGALLEWTAAVAGNLPITGYTAVAELDGDSLHYNIPATATSIILAGLSNDDEWTITLLAYSSAGDGPATDAVTITPTSSDPEFDPSGANVVYPTETVPDPPVLDELVASDGSAGVYWTEPTFTGNTDLTSYEVDATSAVDGVRVTYSVPVITGVLTGALIGPLTNGEEYTVVVRAQNIVGSSVDSNSLTVTPDDGLPPILDLPGYEPPPEPPPYREPDPVYWAFPQRHYFTPANWGLTELEAEVRENA